MVEQAELANRFNEAINEYNPKRIDSKIRILEMRLDDEMDEIGDGGVIDRSHYQELANRIHTLRQGKSPTTCHTDVCGGDSRGWDD